MSVEKLASFGETTLANTRPNGSDHDELPKAELNPLLNPLLEQNLGRWAQVYFTSPPELRERAVTELLRELEASAAHPAPAAPRPEPAQRIVCPSCERGNRAGQRFCGYCGAPLRPIPQSQGWNQPQPAAPRPSPQADTIMAETPSVLGLSSMPGESDLDFLRERSYVQEYDQPGGRGKYLIALVVVLIAGITYLEWPNLRTRLAAVQHSAAVAPAQQAATPPAQPAGSPAETSAPPTAASQHPSESDLPPQSPTTQKSAAETAGIPPARTSAQGEGRAQPPTPAQAVKLASDAQHSAPQADGSQELSLAERYLEGTNGPRDTTTAARWLWKAVSKQNTRADMLLADLYARGDGVAKSCDQARLLLTAASEKGDSQAAQRLRNLESGGCR
jgi:hypothetical protein